MANELPYFKFRVSEWNDGKITLESFYTQGVFINICSMYWSRSGQITLSEIKRRLSKVKPTAFKSLLQSGLIQVKNDFLKIKFLDEQFAEYSERSLTNSANGRLGGRPKKATALISLTEQKPNVNPIREDKIREDNTREEQSTLSKAVFLLLQRKGSNTMEVTSMVKQWINEGHKDILIQLKAMKAYYARQGLVFPSRIETLTKSFMESDWIEKLKETDPEQQEKIIQNGKQHKPEPDLIGSSKPGSLE